MSCLAVAVCAGRQRRACWRAEEAHSQAQGEGWSTHSSMFTALFCMRQQQTQWPVASYFRRNTQPLRNDKRAGKELYYDVGSLLRLIAMANGERVVSIY
eukprot:scaffold272143_cov32-Prasinocladus_malaysianus.AAC.1